MIHFHTYNIHLKCSIERSYGVISEHRYPTTDNSLIKYFYQKGIY